MGTAVAAIAAMSMAPVPRSARRRSDASLAPLLPIVSAADLIVLLIRRNAFIAFLRFSFFYIINEQGAMLVRAR